VGLEFEARFVERDAAFARFFARGRDGRRQFDLPGFCVDRLQQAGVGRIEEMQASHDTYARPDLWFSHRRAVHRGEGDYGRNCSGIMLG
jgi:copper oxidase (laccase) domain-containing protein